MSNFQQKFIRLLWTEYLCAPHPLYPVEMLTVQWHSQVRRITLRNTAMLRFKEMQHVLHHKSGYEEKSDSGQMFTFEITMLQDVFPTERNPFFSTPTA